MPIRNNDDGQSAIEFILTFAFALGLIFLFVNQALNLTGGYLAHYVNFMAARAYLVAENGIDSKETNDTNAKNIAKRVYRGYALEAFGIESEFRVISSREANAVFTGTILKFEKPLSSLPFVGGGEDALFYSESFLGKEPYRITCQQMICAAMTGSLVKCNASSETMDIVLYDNGC